MLPSSSVNDDLSSTRSLQIAKSVSLLTGTTPLRVVGIGQTGAHHFAAANASSGSAQT